jgi:beta-galactosidase beta subunit
MAGDTNHPTDTTTGMSTRSYKITPDAFYSSLKHQIVPKDGESDIQLLRRYFQEHHIDLVSPKAAVFLNEKLGQLFVRVTPSDQNKVERLVVQIANTK